MLITLVRHGESTGNIMQQWQGITDGPLTEKGVLQAKLVSRALSNYKFSTIFSSPLSRAFDTAKIIRKGLSTSYPPEIIINPLFIELNMGSMEQVSWNVPFRIHTRDTCFPKGESLNDVLKRALLSLDLLLYSNNNKTNDIKEEEEGEHILVVSHGMFLTELIHALCIHYNYQWIDLTWSNTGVTTIEIKQQEEEKIQFKCINNIQHLI
ncbi:histidine phosphatase superfamily [Circinella umbellata]|nr:histidine phosphatase superfamily [Circinella umbellata]